MKTIAEIDRSECFGCDLCADICPRDAIEMKTDNCFRYPFINTDKCIRCGKCFAMCPVNSPRAGTRISIACIVSPKGKSGNESTAIQDVISCIAESFTGRSRVTIGPAADKDGTVRHICIEQRSDVDKISSVKYAESRMIGVYKETDEQLRKGKHVLFIGTPCQVAAMRKRFPNNNNIYYADTLCRGAGSAELLSEDLRRVFPHEETVENLQYETVFENGKRNCRITVYGQTEELRLTSDNDAYCRLLTENSVYRECCHDCPFSGGERQGDITLGELSEEEAYRYFNMGRALTVAFPVTDKGSKVMEKVKSSFKYTEKALSNIEVKVGSSKSQNFDFSSGRGVLDGVQVTETPVSTSRQIKKQPASGSVRKSVALKISTVIKGLAKM